MVVLGHFYRVIERPVSHVSIFWKVAHTLACVSIAVCGILTAFTFGRVLANFSYNCILNAQLNFEEKELNTTWPGPKVKAIDLSSSVWGSVGECNFAQFTPLVTMISAVIWGSYFVFSSRGGAGYPTDMLSKSWSMVYPSIIFTIVFFIVYVISTLKMKNGLDKFCGEFNVIFNNTHCTEEINIYTTQFTDGVQEAFYAFYPNMLVAVTCAQIGIWSWVVQLVLCVTRIACFADFEMQVVTVMSKEEEHVENVVELSGLRDADDETSEV